MKQVQTALRSGDVELAHAKLDLFWARLAVHIRAEHLHLFPTVLSRLENGALNDPSLTEAQTVTAELRLDHDFFMHELARGIQITREMLTVLDQSAINEGLNKVKNIVFEVEQRLIKHNEVEESQIYLWASTLLNSEEQARLARKITTELRKHPPRFIPTTWLGE